MSKDNINPSKWQLSSLNHPHKTSGYRSNSQHLLGLGKTNLAVAKIVDAVPLAQESVTEDSERTNRLREVHAHEGANAGALNLQNVVKGCDGKVVAAQGNGQVGERVALSTVDCVLAVPRLLGANLFVAIAAISYKNTIRWQHNLQELSNSRRQSNQRSTGIQDDTGVVKLSNTVAKCKGVKVDLPVGLAAERDLGELSSVVALVNTTKGSLRGITVLAGITQIKGKYGLVKSLLVQQVVERGHNLVHRDGVETETEDTIEFAKGESQTRLAGGLGKVLVLDFEVTDGDNIVRDKALQAARAVLDGELTAVLLEGRRGRRVVLAVQITSDRAAGRRGNPQVRATSVQDDLEALRGCADGNLRVVCKSH